MGQVKKQKGQAKAAMGQRAAPVLQEHEKTMAAIKESGILSALQRKKQVYANQYIVSQRVPGYVPDYYIVTHCCRSRICSYILRWSLNAFMIAFVVWLIKRTVDMMLADFVGGWSWLGTLSRIRASGSQVAPWRWEIWAQCWGRASTGAASRPSASRANGAHSLMNSICRWDRAR